MKNDEGFLNDLKGALHHALERAIETDDPDERNEAIGAAIEEMRELNARDSELLVRRILELHRLV